MTLGEPRSKRVLEILVTKSTCPLGVRSRISTAAKATPLLRPARSSVCVQQVSRQGLNEGARDLAPRDVSTTGWKFNGIAGIMGMECLNRPSMPRDFRGGKGRQEERARGQVSREMSRLINPSVSLPLGRYLHGPRLKASRPLYILHGYPVYETSKKLEADVRPLLAAATIKWRVATHSHYPVRYIKHDFLARERVL